MTRSRILAFYQILKMAENWPVLAIRQGQVRSEALAATRVESMATCPSRPIPSDRANSTTCVNRSFRARRAASETGSASKSPAPLRPPDNGTPGPPAPAVPDGGPRSRPARRHTATPSATAPDDRPGGLLPPSPAQKHSVPAAPQLGAQKNRCDLLPAPPARWAAADTLAPGCRSRI